MAGKINKKIITDTIFILGCFLVYIFFPAKDSFQQIVATIVFFVVLPLIYKKFILKEKIASMGFVVGKWKNGIKYGSISLLVSFLIFLGILKNTNYFEAYKLPISAVNNFGYFVAYEVLLVPLFVALYELFFRGFILFSFNKFSYGAILIQWTVLIMLFYQESFKPEFLPYLIFAPFAGIIAYKSNSIYYSFLSQYIFIFLVDVSIIKMLQ